jgi:hypothetical protein
LSKLLFKTIKGISCETGDAFFNVRSQQTTTMPAEILFPVISIFVDSVIDQKGNAMAKSDLPAQESSEIIGQEEKRTIKKGNASLKARRLKPMKLKKTRPPQWRTRNHRGRPAPIAGAMMVTEHEKSQAKEKQAGFHEGQKVEMLISARTEMGFVAVINGTQKGILYENEVFQPLIIGQEIDGFIKKVREDKKIDLCLQRPGYRAVVGLARRIMDELQQQGGFITVTDKSRPKVIADLFGVSKRTFKKAIGNLYKKRLIALEENGIRLLEKKEKTLP